MNVIKKTVVLLLVASLGLSIPFQISAVNVWDSDYLAQENNSALSVTDNNDIFEKAAEKNDITLFVNKTSGCFYVENVVTGDRWYSNPQNITDQDATGLNQMEALSTILFNVYNENGSIVERGNSEALAVRSGKTSYNSTDNGFVINYEFTDLNITVPLEIVLTDKGFKATVNIKEIDENGELMTVSLLPFFHAGEKDEKGYLLLPDGSGSLLYFNNGHRTASEYNVPIYGKDITSATVTKPQDTYNANMPIFGIKKDTASFLAVIEDGAAQARVHAATNGKNTEYANCYSEFVLRGSDTVVLGEETGLPQSYQIYQRDSIDFDKISIEYILLSGETVDYNTMASVYRDYLIEKYGLKETKSQNVGLYLDFYGAVKKKKSFFGIPFTINEKLSDPEDIKKIVGELSENGIEEVNIVLKEWTKAQLSQKADNRFEAALGIGSTKKINELNKYLEEKGGNLFPQFNISSTARSGNGISIYSDTINNVSNMPAGKYTYKDNMLVKDNDILKQLFINVDSQKKLINKIFKSLDKFGVQNVAFDSLDVYSDFKNNTISRESNAKAMSEMLKSAASKNVASDFPADYALYAVKTALNTPVESNKYSITDCSVPFYQLSLSGLVECVVSPLNLSSDYKNSLLKMIETGSSLHYSFITEENEKVMNTELDWLYSVDYEKWKDRVLEAYAIIAELNTITEGTRMVSHIQLEENVYQIVYENNASVYVNYSADEYTVDGNVIPPVGYLFREKDGE